MFWFARIYALYHLDSAIYLPFCDLFVTDDVRQRRALRAVNVVNPRGTRIMSHPTLQRGRRDAAQPAGGTPALL